MTAYGQTTAPGDGSNLIDELLNRLPKPFCTGLEIQEVLSPAVRIEEVSEDPAVANAVRQNQIRDDLVRAVVADQVEPVAVVDGTAIELLLQGRSMGVSFEVSTVVSWARRTYRGGTDVTERGWLDLPAWTLRELAAVTLGRDFRSLNGTDKKLERRCTDLRLAVKAGKLDPAYVSPDRNKYFCFEEMYFVPLMALPLSAGLGFPERAFDKSLLVANEHRVEFPDARSELAQPLLGLIEEMESVREGFRGRRLPHACWDSDTDEWILRPTLSFPGFEKLGDEAGTLMLLHDRLGRHEGWRLLLDLVRREDESYSVIRKELAKNAGRLSLYEEGEIDDVVNACIRILTVYRRRCLAMDPRPDQRSDSEVTAPGMILVDKRSVRIPSEAELRATGQTNAPYISQTRAAAALGLTSTRSIRNLHQKGKLNFSDTRKVVIDDTFWSESARRSRSTRG